MGKGRVVYGLEKLNISCNECECYDFLVGH